MRKTSRRRPRIGVARLNQIFNHESGSAHPAQQRFPRMNKFKRSSFAMLQSANFRRQRAFLMIGVDQRVTSRSRQRGTLEACGLFMLADV